MRINPLMGSWPIQQLQQLQSTQASMIAQLATGTVPYSSNIALATTGERLRSQISGFRQAMSETYNAIGMLVTTEGGLNAVSSNLQRMRELAVQASSSTLSESERAALQKEFEQLSQQINKTSQQLSYNNIKVLAGDITNFQVQTGPNPGQNVSITVPRTDIETLGLKNVNISTAQNAQQALQKIDKALENVANIRSYVGATTNRLATAARELGNSMLNIMSSLSIISDTDMARTVLEFTRNRLMTQSTLGIMVQSNVSRQSILRILTG